MRNSLDFTSWQGLLSTLLGLVLVSLVAVGIRIVVMLSVQQRRERQNRQINERLKTLIAAYKVLGGSFTGELAVDPSHLRELRTRGLQAARAQFAQMAGVDRELAGERPAEHLVGRDQRLEPLVDLPVLALAPLLHAEHHDDADADRDQRHEHQAEQGREQALPGCEVE
ncbi:hypothetical protein [Variovorax paradoxus]|uniref:hypothetical protein n=1 Tax=Variovorax paradoxus TaxID=34073 RepID=UPI000B1D7687